MLIEKDSQLAARISFQKKDAPLEEVLKELRKKTKLSISSTLSRRYALFASEKPLFSVMDSIAALDELRWEKIETGYELIQSFYTGREPVNALQEVYNREGMKLIHAFLSLPKATKEGLKKGMSLDQLPEAMYPPVLTTIQAQLRADLTTLKPGESIDATPADFTRSRIRVFVEEAEGDGNFNQYKVQFAAPALSAGYTVNDYAEKRELHEKEKFRNNENPAFPHYEAISGEVAPAKARAQKELVQPVAISLRNVTFPDVLGFLAEKYNIASVADTASLMPQVATVRLPELPLARALDRLTRLYESTEWEWRRLGFVVVRGPYNLTCQRHRRSG